MHESSGESSYWKEKTQSTDDEKPNRCKKVIADDLRFDQRFTKPIQQDESDGRNKSRSDPRDDESRRRRRQVFGV